MRKLKFAVLLLFYTISSFSPVYSIDLETLRCKLNYTCTIADITEAKKLAIQNMSLTEQILFLNDTSSRNNGTARCNIIQILRRCAINGTISQSHFFDLILRLYNQITSIALAKTVELEKGDIKGVLTSIGNDAPLATNFSTFPVMANSLTTSGFIKNQGILNSLTQKIANAKDILDKKGADAKNTAINKIQAAINELDAQRGKHITEDGYQILSGYCRNLIAKIQATNQ
jgi:hypothetical protein